MKSSIRKQAVILLIGCLVLTLGSCVSNPPRQSTSIRRHRPLTTIKHPRDEGIVYYDVFFEIDPLKNIFSSQQRVTITANLAEGHKLMVYAWEELVIDQLALEDDKGKELAITIWQKVGSYSIDYPWMRMVFSEIEIETTKAMPTHGQLIVKFDYHLPKEAVQKGLAGNMVQLFASSQGSHAGGPESGAFPLVSGKLEAPFRITIKHPDSFQCALPGEQFSKEESAGYVTVTYRADIPYDPSFSCAPYQVISKDIEGMRIELFMPIDVDLSPEMLTTAAQILSFYQEKFGEAPADSFRIVFPNLDNDEGGGESNGNIVFLGNIQTFLNYEENEEAKDTFAHLIAHEGYHLWNTWGLDWEGTLAEWWVEGGANFMASWAKEMLYGNAYGANNRLNHLKGFNEQKAYQYQKSLANLDNNWFEDWALVYDYGALVWEQLRQKVGSEALIAGLRDFYETHGNQTTNYNEFVSCMEKHTEVDVAAALAQWTEHNARIDLMIQDVTIRYVNGRYEVQVDLEIDADRDYELFTALGYKTSLDENWQLINLHLTKAGRQRIKFKSDGKPLEIQIDPEYRVPQINLDNNTWVEGSK